MSIDFKTYLTPSIPQEIFNLISKYLENYCKIKVNLLIETSSSGPKKNEPMIEDLSFMCSPPYYWLNEKYKDEIELIPYAPIFDDNRNNDEPVYFSDILIHQDNNKIKSINDLNGDTWLYNDTESLSGYFCIKQYEDKIKMVCSGSHLNSINMVSKKEADITCIDSNVLLFNNNKLKMIGSFGPHPIQPCVIRKDCKYKDKIIDAFKNINDSDIIDDLNKFKIKKFGNVSEDFYFKKYSIENLLL